MQSLPESVWRMIQTPFDEAALLSTEETIELFRSKVEQARQQALDGEKLASTARPKLTLDISYCSLANLPEAVVQLIKDEVERLALSHNELRFISPHFSACSHLRYLNLRHNAFQVIPLAVYGMRALEILDVSHNDIMEISIHIRSLTRLQIFDFAHCKISDIPAELSELPDLQRLRITNNPLRLELRELFQREIVTPEMSGTGKKWVLMTPELERFLRVNHRNAAPINLESQADEEALDRHLSIEHPHFLDDEYKHSISPATRTSDPRLFEGTYSNDTEHAFNAPRSSNFEYLGGSAGQARSSDYLFSEAEHDGYARSSNYLFSEAGYDRQDRSSNYLFSEPGEEGQARSSQYAFADNPKDFPRASDYGIGAGDARLSQIREIEPDGDGQGR